MVEYCAYCGTRVAVNYIVYADCERFYCSRCGKLLHTVRKDLILEADDEGKEDEEHHER